MATKKARNQLNGAKKLRNAKPLGVVKTLDCTRVNKIEP